MSAGATQYQVGARSVEILMERIDGGRAGATVYDGGGSLDAQRYSSPIAASARRSSSFVAVFVRCK